MVAQHARNPATPSADRDQPTKEGGVLTVEEEEGGAAAPSIEQDNSADVVAADETITPDEVEEMIAHDEASSPGSAKDTGMTGVVAVDKGRSRTQKRSKSESGKPCYGLTTQNVRDLN